MLVISITAEEVKPGDVLLLALNDTPVRVEDTFRSEIEGVEEDERYMVVITPEHRQYVLHPLNVVRKVVQL